MAKRDEYEKRFEEILKNITDENNLEIYDVEYVKDGSDWCLRGYIDKPEGVSIDDCEKVSRAVSDILDANDFIEDQYVLEISSPGLGRALKKEKHLKKSIGEEVEVKTYQAIEKQKNFSGILKAFTKENITLQMDDGVDHIFDRANIALIRLAVHF